MGYGMVDLLWQESFLGRPLRPTVLLVAFLSRGAVKDGLRLGAASKLLQQVLSSRGRKLVVRHGY